jgi:flagellar hook-associated protein 3 FlgL
MALASVSSATLASFLNQSVASMQSQLTDTELELSTGQDADIGQTLGASSGEDVSLQQLQTFLQTLTTTNNSADTRLTTTQNILSNVQSTAQTFLNSLIANQGNQGQADTLAESATSGLQSLTSNLNSTLNGDYLFAGTNTANAPITDFFAPGALNATNVNNAIGTLGPLSSVSGAAMTAFLATGGPFDSQFIAGPNTWAPGWSSASNQPVTSLISTTDTENTSVSANQTAFQQLAEAYTMVSTLGNQNLTSGAFQAVMSQAESLLTSSINGLVDIQSNVGVTQAAITSSNAQMSAQMTIISQQVDTLQSADAYNAATQVNALQTQIETAYSLTSQLHQLSLVNYLQT